MYGAMKTIPGQRWMSTSEPELGLGILLEVESRRLQILFPGTGELRLYAAQGAPIKRVTFEPGDMVYAQDGRSFTVISVENEAGLLTYIGSSESLPEAHLADALDFNRAEQYLQQGKTSEASSFRLRQDALDLQHKMRRSPARGFAGGRIDLIPHQLYIAQEVSRRHSPRVLLSDEVGLGKTIEAGLILHRMYRSGRAQRVLIVVPDALVHQWFVELYRRFSLTFTIVDSEGAKSGDFADEQLLLCGLPTLCEAEACEAALAEDWDLVIVDEAHHLAWSPEMASMEYQIIQSLGQKSDALLLLTATPEQLGPESHFARLRLLDPHRYPDYEQFQAESEDFKKIAQDAKLLLGDQLNDLLDRYGPGRVIFRNTRANISGFPPRIPKPVLVDDKVEWLAELLEELAPEKVLVITSSQSDVEKLGRELEVCSPVRITQFHEGLSLMERDRNAAWFGEPEGARCLLCSEIGGEGRNFQFAHHLVLMDLPPSPEKVEQRIGRLDRIGQRHPIQIHVPYTEETESRFRWYHEGLEVFARALRAGHLYRKYLEESPEKTKAYRDEIEQKLEEGRDTLLEMHSHKPEVSAALIEQIELADQDPETERIIVALFDHFGWHAEETGAQAYRLKNRVGQPIPLPGMPPEGLSITFDRTIALQRQELTFITLDHPLVTAMADCYLGEDDGVFSLAIWEDEQPGLFLEGVFLVECIAPSELFMDRFLPPEPIRVLVDASGKECVGDFEVILPANLLPGTQYGLLDQSVISDGLPKMLGLARSRAEKYLRDRVYQAKKTVKSSLGEELNRLVHLRERNPNIRDEEVTEAVEEMEQIKEHAVNARVRLDSLRVIWRGNIRSLK